MEEQLYIPLYMLMEIFTALDCLVWGLSWFFLVLSESIRMVSCYSLFTWTSSSVQPTICDYPFISHSVPYDLWSCIMLLNKPRNIQHNYTKLSDVPVIKTLNKCRDFLNCMIFSIGLTDLQQFLGRLLAIYWQNALVSSLGGDDSHISLDKGLMT